MELSSVNQYFGNLDLYLLDQILKKRFHAGMKVLDAGCGEGRNIMYFLNAGFTVYAIDRNQVAVSAMQFIAASKRPDLSKDHFQVADLDNLPYPGRSFDLIICCGVLHHARNEDHFFVMFDQLLRCLKPGGILFVSMASNIGIEELVSNRGSGQYQLPDGSLRFLLTRNLVTKLKRLNKLYYLEPLTTVNTADTRCLSVLVLSIHR